MKILKLFTVLLIGLTFGVATSSRAAEVIGSGTAKLTAYWNFDDASVATNTVDLKHGIRGQVAQGAAFTDAGGGRSGSGADRAIDFGTNGLAQRVLVTNVEWLNQIARGGDQITVSFWQKLRTTAASAAFWAVTPTRERAVSAHVPWSDNTVYWDTGGATANTTRISATTAAITTLIPGFAWTNWHHFAFVKNETVKQIWIDGILVQEGPSTVPLVTDISLFSIGCQANTTTGAIRGMLDEFAVFATALDQTQIGALASGTAATALDADTDGDGIPDWWEDKYGLDKNNPADASLDGDADGLTNLQEYARLTDPTNPDTDDDGLKDGVETNTGVWVSATNTGTDPIRADTDDDGLSDGVETNTGTFVDANHTGTNPLLKDTDGDGFNDYTEVALGGDPTVAATTPLKAGNVNLLAWWNFDDATSATTSTDKVHGFVGELLNGAVYTDVGLGRTGSATDRAMDFGPGAGELMNILNPRWIGALSAQDSVTISFWQKLNAVLASSAFYFDDNKVYNTPILNGHVPYSDRVIYFDTTTSAAAGRISKKLPDTFDVTVWHHYAFVKSGNTKRIYIDGTLFLEGSNTAPLPNDVPRAFVGGHIGTPTPKSSINGLIDDFAIYAKALDATEVGVLAAGGTPTSLAGDKDGDGMPDAWEDANGFDKNNPADAALDSDNDGLTNLQEYLKGTDPHNPDTDGDGLKDGVETNTGVWVSATNTGTNPLLADTDGDGLSDGVESNTGIFVSASNTGTNPLKKDSDSDLFPDGTEVLLGSNPNVAGSTPIVKNAPNLLAYWNFNDATDPKVTVDVVHGIRGTLDLDAAFTDDTFGHTGAPGDRSIDLNGTTGNMVRISSPQWINAAAVNDEITFSWWQHHYNPTPGVNASFWVESGNTALNRWAAAHAPWSDDTIYFDTGGGATAGTHRIFKSMLTVNSEFDWTQWHHFAMVKKGLFKQIYVDGALFTDGAVTTALQNDAVAMTIGGSTSGANPFFGKIDDFAVFGSALTADQIMQLVNGTSPTAIVSVDFSILTTAFSGGFFTVTWQSQAGQTFKVYRSIDPATGWTSVLDVNASATGSTTSYSDNAPPAGAKAVFYKIQRQ